MSDDLALVKQLRWLGDHASFEPHMHHVAADRIEKLEAENEELQSKVGTVRLAAKYAAKIRDDRIEKLEAALRAIAQTVTIEDENWHPSYHDFSFTQKQAEGAYEELGRRIGIARNALEGKDGIVD